MCFFVDFSVCLFNSLFDTVTIQNVLCVVASEYLVGGA